MTFRDWTERTLEVISENMSDFYESFYSIGTQRSGTNSISLKPCPMCGHSDCATANTQYNSVHCFSPACEWKGNHISGYVKYAEAVLNMPAREAYAKIAGYTGIPYPTENSAEDQQRYRKQKLLLTAKNFFYEQLINCTENVPYKGMSVKPLAYLQNIRKRKEDTIKEFKIGLTSNFPELFNALVEQGFSAEEIREAGIKPPAEYLFIFFYEDPITREICRINTKNPFLCEREIDGKMIPIKGWSVGEKHFMYTPKFSFKKPVLLVEGEHDLFSCYEHGASNIVCFGGNISDETLSILDKCENTIFTAFDNDEAGEKYTKRVNEMFPDKTVVKIQFPQIYNDIDEYYVTDPNPCEYNELIAKYSIELETNGFRIHKHDTRQWTIANRERKIEFIIRGVTPKLGIQGQVNLYDNSNELIDRADNTTLQKCKKSMQPLAFKLADAIEDYFNRNIIGKSFDELLEIYQFSSNKTDIIKALANCLYTTDNPDKMTSDMKFHFKDYPESGKVIDEVLIEYNNVKNAAIVDLDGIVHKMKVAQYCNIPNDDAYFYFTLVKDDGDARRAIPYLLKNDKTMIRLDILKRKDPQCLLLVDNRYELPFEIPTAIFDSSQCSLQPVWADKWVANEISDEEIDPATLIKEIERWIRRFYFTTDDNIYKVLSLWIYGTYYYVMFQQFPYLYVNGEKGSGKSILLGVTSMLAFNGRAVVDISEASLFRMAGIEGGTIMLDEQESLTSRTASTQSAMGPILKGGYAVGSYVYRFNMEKNCQEGFDPYCPKVIANILGLEDIIFDRCLPINTYRLQATKENKLEDYKYYMEHEPEKYRSVTSKCCISALIHFQHLHDIFIDKENMFENDNARLSQILTPIFAVAKMVDEKEREMLISKGIKNPVGEYEKAFVEYYNATIDNYKKVVEDSTPEGVIKKITSTIAKELVGVVMPSEKYYTDTSKHKYIEPIKFDISEGWFEVNVMHFRCFIEENMPGDTVYIRLVPKWLKTCYKIDDSNIKRKTIKLANEELIRELKGTSQLKVNFYRFYFRDFIPAEFLERIVPTVPAPKEIEDKDFL